MTDALSPRLLSYLLTNRAFVAPAVGEAVACLDLPAGARILDVGTGGGGGAVALARAADGVTVQGIDLDERVIPLAVQHAAAEGVADRVDFQARDMREVAASGARFDAIWASDAIWPGHVDDPALVVRELVAALNSDGILALFTSNYYQSMFLPGRSRLQRKLRHASELRWDLPTDGPDHYERHVAWLVAAGLREVSLHVIPRVAYPLDRDPTARPYLERTVWPELLEAAALRGHDAGLSAEELAEVRELLTPGGPRYVLDEPGHYLVHPTLLVTGRR